jgi:hypothetical protein
MVDTIISFIVSVPVLSVLMALVEPRVSTSVRFLTIAFLGELLRAIGRQRGDKRRHPGGDGGDGHRGTQQQEPVEADPANRPADHDVHAMRPRTFVREPSSFCSGDRVRVTEVSIVANLTPFYPIWSLLIIALDVTLIWALTTPDRNVA